MSPIPSERGPDANLTRKEFEEALNSLKNGKATGPDAVPVEVFKSCPKIKSSLFNLLDYIWKHECLPENLVTGKFVMLWKGSNKGPSDDPSTYRCICLLNHAYKVLSVIMLNRLLHRKTKIVQDACDTFSRRLFSRRLSRRFSKIPGVLKERLERYLEERLENVYLEKSIFKIHVQDTFQDAILKILLKTPFSRHQVS